jgi:acetate kinase
MGGCDAIVFTAGIGENDARVRRLVVEQLGTVFGCKINNEINEAKDTRGNETDLTAEGSSMKVFLIPTNEELVIARDTYRLLKL